MPFSGARKSPQWNSFGIATGCLVFECQVIAMVVQGTTMIQVKALHMKNMSRRTWSDDRTMSLKSQQVAVTSGVNISLGGFLVPDKQTSMNLTVDTPLSNGSRCCTNPNMISPTMTTTALLNKYECYILWPIIELAILSLSIFSALIFSLFILSFFRISLFRFFLFTLVNKSM